MAFQTKIVWFFIAFGASLVIILSLGAIPSAYAIPKFIVLIIAVILLIIAYSTRYFAYMFEPFIRMKKREVILDSEEAYGFASSNNAIIIREGTNIFATAFVKIPVYVSATEMADEDKATFANMFGRILALSKDPVKISAELYVINKDPYTDSIKIKLSQAEDKYNTLMNTLNRQGVVSKDSIQSSEADRMRGELTMWRNMLDTVSKARAQALVTFVSISAQGGTEEEAINLALTKADEFAAGVSAILGVTATMAVGSEILPFIEPDSMIPVTNVSERLRAKTVDQ